MSEPFLDRLHDELCAAAWREIEGGRRPRAWIALPLFPLAAAAAIAAMVFTGVRALHADDTAVAPSRAHSAFASALTEHFSVLRRAPTARDAVPTNPPRPMASGSIRQADFAGALRLADGVWVMPSGSQACLLQWVNGRGSMGCSAPPTVVGGGLFVVEIRPKVTRVWGLLPNGAHDVSLTRSHGGAVSVALSQGNFYAVSVTGNPRYLRFTGASGKRHTVKILPPIKGELPVVGPSATPTP
jgi:hypothetical protein